MLNRVVLVGRLTKDPELKHTPNGVAVCNFTLAVNRPFSSGNGERQADFIQCVAWRKSAENMCRFLTKGSQTGLDGRLQTRSFEGQDGKRVYVTEMVAESVQFLEPKKERNQSDSGSYQGQEPPPATGYNNNDPFNNAGEPMDISDDDLPF